MDCALIRDLLPNFLDEELTEELTQRVRAHLLRCRDCAWEVESLQQTTAALHDAAREPRPSEDLRRRLLEELLRDHRAAAGRPRRTPPLWQQEPRRIFVLEDPAG